MISSVGAFVPPDGVPIARLKDELGLNATAITMYERYLGLREVRLARDTPLVEALHHAASGLSTLAGREHLVRYLIHARTLEPVGGPPGLMLAQLRRRLGLHCATAFALSQHACASGLLALDVAAKLLTARGDPQALALVVSGETAHPHMMRLMAPVTVVSDGAAACLLELGSDRDVLRGYATRTHGAYYAALSSDADVMAAFQRDYPKLVSDVVDEVLDAAGLRLPDVGLILPMNTSQIAWVQWCRAVGYPVDRMVLDNVPALGHCFCADPFLNYRLAASRLEPGTHYLMLAVGQGGVFSAALFRH